MEVPSAALEFRTIHLKDRRLEDRARLILGRLEAAPDVGFPQAMIIHAAKTSPPGVTPR